MSVVQFAEFKLPRWTWVGGRLWVDEDRVRFIGSETVIAERQTGIVTRYTSSTMPFDISVPGGGIDSVERRRDS